MKNTQTINSEEQGKTSVTCYEEIGARTEYSKQFVNPKTGMHTAVLFSSPVHYAEGSEMEEIDNEFVDGVNDNGEEVFENRKNKFLVRLAKSTAHKKLVELIQGDYRISMSPIDSKKTKIKRIMGAIRRDIQAVCKIGKAVDEPSKINEISHGVARLAMKKQTPAEIRFGNVVNNSDFEYIVENNRLKENIVVNSKSEAYEYLFKLELSKLEARVNGKEIELYDVETNKAKFIIPAPYMYDADGKKSEAVSYTLEGAAGNYKLQIAADAEWINADERKFPVVIDPQIACNDNSAIKLMSAEYNSQKYYAPTDSIITIGNNRYNNFNHEYVAKISLDGPNMKNMFGSGLRITHAMIELTKTGEDRCDYLNAYYVREGSRTGKVLDVFTGAGSNNRIDIDVTNQVQRLIDGDEEEIDIFIERINAGDNDTDYMFIATEKIDVDEYKPRIFIDFVSPRLNTDEMAYATASAGRAGIGSVNINTGRLVFEHRDMSINKNGVSLGISHVYNDFVANKKSDGISVLKTTPDLRCGKGFKMNIQQYLFRRNRGGLMGSENYIYIDGKGGHHDFVEKYYYKDEYENPHYVSLEDCTEDVYGNLTYEVNEKTFSIEHSIENELGMRLDTYKKVLEMAINGQSAETKYYFCNEDGTFQKIDLNEQQSPYTFAIKEYEDGTKIRIGNRIDVREIEQYHSLLKNYENTINSLNIQIASVKSLIDYYTGKLDANSSNAEDYQEQLFNARHMLFSYEHQLKLYTEERDKARRSLENAVAKIKREPIDFVTDSDENVLGFDYDGRLVMINGGGKNIALIIYDIDDKIQSVADKDGNPLLQFTYKSGLLDCMTDSNGRTLKFEYNNELLQSVVYDSGEKSTFEYGGGYMTKATGIAFESAIFKRETAGSKKVIRIKEVSTLSRINSIDALNGEEMVLSDKTLAYSKLKTVISDCMSGGVDTYIFDVIGRPVTVYSQEDGRMQTVTTDYYARQKSFTGVCDRDDSENLIVNGKFTDGSASWSIGSSSFVKSTLFDDAQDLVLPLDGSASQTVNIAAGQLKSGKTYMLSAWAKASSLYIVSNRRQTAYGNDIFGWYEKDAADDYKADRTFGIVANIYRGASLIASYEASFDNYNEDWQYAALPIYIADASQVTKIVVILSYWNNEGPVRFTNCSLRECKEFAAREFDGDGKLVKERTQDGVTEYTYTDGRLTCKTFTDGNGYVSTAEYRYDGHNRPCFIRDYDGLCYEAFYDDNGNIIRAEKYSMSDTTTKYIREFEYDDDGNVIGLTDPRGDLCGEKLSNKISYRNGIESELRTAAQSVTAVGYDRFADENTGISCDAFGDGNDNKLIYNKGYLTTVSHNGFDVDYEYDGKGRVLKTSIGGTTIATNTFTDAEVAGGDSSMVTAIFGNSSTLKVQVKTVFDKSGRIKSVTDLLNQNTLLQNVYGENDKLEQTVDGLASITYSYTYNEDELTKTTFNMHDESVELETIDDEECVRNTLKIGETTRVNEDIYDDADNTLRRKLRSQKLPNNLKYNPKTDAFGRMTGATHLCKGERVLTEERYFVKRGDRTCDLVSSERFGINGDITEHVKYMYDKAGNISEIYDNGQLVSRYFYDDVNRLIREDNVAFDKTTTFVYDIGGNILRKIEYAFTLGDIKGKTPTAVIPYTYDASTWRDRMTSYNGEVCEYDGMLIPSTYRNHALAWNKFGMLESFGDKASYAYTVNGIRTSKTVNGKTTKFFLNGSRILRSVIDNGAEIWYNYSVNGIHGLTVIKDGEKTEYVFRKNVFGDVTHIYKSDIGDAVTLPNLTLAATYKYDAWGKCDVTDVDGSGIGELNPIRYRGYYFDEETALYYLNARYYDPETGRFISADDTKFLDPNTVNGLNLFAYCNSNPVMNIDPSGRSVIAFIIAALAIAGVIIGGVYTYNKAQEAGYSGWELFGWTLLGMVGGGVAGAAVGAFVGWAVPAIGAFMGTTFTLGSVITASGAAVAVTVTGAQIVAGIAAVAGVAILFSEIPMQGIPNSTYGNGGSYGVYDGNGNLIYRHDEDHWHHIKSLHEYYNPHTHYFIWKKIKGVWKIARKIVFPF